jgi:hypothetical protein
LGLDEAKIKTLEAMGVVGSLEDSES